MFTFQSQIITRDSQPQAVCFLASGQELKQCTDFYDQLSMPPPPPPVNKVPVSALLMMNVPGIVDSTESINLGDKSQKGTPPDCPISQFLEQSGLNVFGLKVVDDNGLEQQVNDSGDIMAHLLNIPVVNNANDMPPDNYNRVTLPSLFQFGMDNKSKRFKCNRYGVRDLKHKVAIEFILPTDGTEMTVESNISFLIRLGSFMVPHVFLDMNAAGAHMLQNRFKSYSLLPVMRQDKSLNVEKCYLQFVMAFLLSAGTFPFFSLLSTYCNM